MSPPSSTARLRPAEETLGTPPKHPTLAGLPKNELLSHRTTNWRDSIPQGRAGNRPDVGSLVHQSPHWENQAIPQGGLPRFVHSDVRPPLDASGYVGPTPFKNGGKHGDGDPHLG